MILFAIYIAVLFFAVLAGFYNVRKFSTAIKIILSLITITLVEEVLAYFVAKITSEKSFIYHIYSIIEICLTTAYFYKTIGVKDFIRYTIISFFIWIVIGLANIFYFQPISEINSNMLILESITIIVMSLYALYKIFIDDSINSITKCPDFWIWTMFLVLWTGSYFFWGFLTIITEEHLYKFRMISFGFQEVLNIIVYMGIGLTFLFYPQKRLK